MIGKDIILEHDDVMEFFEDIYIDIDGSKNLSIDKKENLKIKIENVMETIRVLKFISV